jgi:flagellar biosynthesis protein FlhF
MLVHTFIVDSASEAVGLIRGKLGPDAVVLSVRKLPADGVSKLWKKPRLEVLATVPSPSVPSPPPGGPEPVFPGPTPEPLFQTPAVDPLVELRRELSEIRAEVSRVRDAGATPTSELPPEAIPEPPPLEPFVPKSVPYPGNWRVGPILEATGLLPRHALRVVERLCQEHGETGPAALGEQLEQAAKILKGEWVVPPSPPPRGASEVHVLVGPPGSGKSTALCKWLAQWVLVEGRSVGVFRLDGATANTGEFLSVYAEVLGVPVQRSLGPDASSATDVVLIDLPGVSHLDRASLLSLKEQLRSVGPARVHLVLNAAYDASLLLAQARAFACLNPTDWMATHLDEEPRWGKLWNVILGTNCPLSWMGVGQNIPGMFHRADPDRLLGYQFRVTSGVDRG